MKTIADKIVAITGAGSGIGRALALEVARHKGMPVLLDVNEKGLEETAQLIAALGGGSERYVLDVRDPAQWAVVADKVIARFGHVDVLINNAGVFSLAQSFLEIKPEYARFIYDVNVWGAFNGARVFVPLLAKRPEAALVNVASSLAFVSSPLYAVYCSSKSAVAGLTNALRQELSHTRIHVMTVFPGPTKTNLGRNVEAADRQKQDEHASLFNKFAITLPETVARNVVKGLLGNRKLVCGSADAKFTQILTRLAPMAGHALMGAVMRKAAGPKLFARLGELDK